MIWFDAKSEHGTLADFLLEYWPLLNPDGGVLMVHFTAGYDPHAGKWWLIDIKELIMKLGLDRGPGIQQLQLIEPHKYRQGAVTMIRRPRARPSLALPCRPAHSCRWTCRLGATEDKYVKMVDHPMVTPQVYKNGRRPPALPAAQAGHQAGEL